MVQIESDVYSQIGLVMLIGLAAKNAILIVEFAKDEYENGKPLVDAALEGARLRLRPILMTSFAFILGCVPLWTASGAGSVARQIMGTSGRRGDRTGPRSEIRIAGSEERRQERRGEEQRGLQSGTSHEPGNLAHLRVRGKSGAMLPRWRSSSG